jgi:hypothetical protein
MATLEQAVRQAGLTLVESGPIDVGTSNDCSDACLIDCICCRFADDDPD